VVGGQARLSRRGLLGAGVTLAAAGAGAALAGCERSQPAPPYYGIQDTDETIDLVQLNEAVDLEYMAIAAYGAAMPLLRGADLALGRRLLAQERQHLDLLLGVFHHVSVTPDQPRASTASHACVIPRMRWRSRRRSRTPRSRPTSMPCPRSSTPSCA
jgi:hypothetical protein